jgi:hypothetical protein
VRQGPLLIGWWMSSAGDFLLKSARRRRSSSSRKGWEDLGLHVEGFCRELRRYFLSADTSALTATDCELAMPEIFSQRSILDCAPRRYSRTSLEMQDVIETSFRFQAGAPLAVYAYDRKRSRPG